MPGINGGSLVKSRTKNCVDKVVLNVVLYLVRVD